MQELKFEELTVEQKLGLVTNINMNYWKITPEWERFFLDQIKKRAVGSVWIQYNVVDAAKYIQYVREHADYPVLIFTDAEAGIFDYKVGAHNVVGCTGSEEHAYAFGKVVGTAARKIGYDVVCNPVLDASNLGSARCIGSNKYEVARLAKAVARGMHDAGILTVAKHFPSPQRDKFEDTHMMEGHCDQTKEELLETSLYPYAELMKEDLLDGIMTGHEKLPNIDPDHPTSLSKKVISIIREMGFDGFAITDALEMMGIKAKYGETDPIGLAIGAGNDIALPFTTDSEKNYNAMVDCYKRGLIDDARLDEAVKRVLAAQHKAFMNIKNPEFTDKELETFNNIPKDAVYAKTDDGLLPSISRDGKHLFSVLIRNEMQVEENKVLEDTFTSAWHFPNKIKERINELFPNSEVVFIKEFPTGSENRTVLHKSLEFEDTVFITFSESMPYAGKECLTRRIESLFEAMQKTNRISTVMHFGNPFSLENLPHIPRYILGTRSTKSMDACLDVLAGLYPAKGKLTFDVQLN